MNNIINFYDLDDVKKFQPEYYNPNFNEDTFPMKHPFRALVIGSSGSGKTNITMNIIQKSSGTFNNIVIYTANKKEPLYEYLESVIDKELLQIHEGLTNLNTRNIDEGFGEGQALVIFDDLVLSREQSRIEELFIRGRKMNNKHGISILYLSQSYFGIPSIIRKQASHLIIKRLSTKKDRQFILKDAGGNLEKEDLEEIYQYCIDGSFTDFLYIDLSETEAKRYRKNFNEIISL
jgi:hypothetical protein